MSKLDRDDAYTHVKTNKNIDFRDVYHHFPKKKYRKYQKPIIKKIVDAFNAGYRFILLAAPTGFGKSAVNVAFCRTMEKSFYITPQNVLINQLHNDFPKIKLIKGRRHYDCVEQSPFKCDDGPCKRDRYYNCYKKYERCLYWRSKNEAIDAQTVLTNFAYFIGEGFIPDAAATPHFGNRDLLVVDESHNVDRHALNFISITLSGYTLPREVYDSLSIPSLQKRRTLSKEGVDSFLDRTRDLCKQFLTSLPDELTGRQVKEEKRANKTLDKISRYYRSQETEWVSQITGKTKRVKVQPVFARGFMDYLLWRRADRFIISSATIFPNNFMKECGIPRKEAKYITAPSTFPTWNRPIIDASAGSLSRAHKYETLPKALATIKKILAKEKEKGVIHAHGYNWKKAIEKEVHDPRLMFHNSQNRDKTLQKFLDSPPEKGRVLVAVAMTEGLDLIGNLANFQILFKCPYPSLGDLRVKYRMDNFGDWLWYDTTTLKTVIQAYGRAVRTEEDQARFYIIDSATIDLLNRQKKRLPRFFKRVYKRMTSLEEWT